MNPLIFVAFACYIFRSKTVLQLWYTDPQGIFHCPYMLEIDARATFHSTSPFNGSQIIFNVSPVDLQGSPF